MPVKTFNIFNSSILRAFVVLKSTLNLTFVIQKLHSFADSLHPKFPYLPYSLWGKRRKLTFFRVIEKQEKTAIIAQVL